MRADLRHQAANKPAAEPASEVERDKAPVRPPIDETIPAMTAKDLATLHANARRLAEGGAPKLQNEAARLLPLIEAELEKRRADAPPARARKVATGVKAAPRTKAAPRAKPKHKAQK